MINTDDINIRDPFILVHQGQYYLYGTRGATCWGPADGFDVYAGRDLVSWEDPHVCFQNDGTFWADRNYWAPEVHAWQGFFYMFASFKSETRRRGTAILRAASPLGPFEPWSDGPVTPAEWECLDGTFYSSADGTPYMVFCHEWVQAGDGEILAMRLTEDLKSAAGEPFLLFHASDAPWSREIHHSSGKTGYVTDGPFLWHGKNGTLLCLWSGFSEKDMPRGWPFPITGKSTGILPRLIRSSWRTEATACFSGPWKEKLSWRSTARTPIFWNAPALSRQTCNPGSDFRSGKDLL